MDCQITLDLSLSSLPNSSLTLKQCCHPKQSSILTSLIQTVFLDKGDDPPNNKNNAIKNSLKIPTTFLLQLFAYQIFLSTTQLSGKVGSLITCQVKKASFTIPPLITSALCGAGLIIARNFHARSVCEANCQTDGCSQENNGRDSGGTQNASNNLTTILTPTQGQMLNSSISTPTKF
ncbi:hypothetical protein ACHAXS_011578 [Conticribra weissflogii]